MNNFKFFLIINIVHNIQTQNKIKNDQGHELNNDRSYKQYYNVNAFPVFLNYNTRQQMISRNIVINGDHEQNYYNQNLQIIPKNNLITSQKSIQIEISVIPEVKIEDNDYHTFSDIINSKKQQRLQKNKVKLTKIIDKQQEFKINEPSKRKNQSQNLKIFKYVIKNYSKAIIKNILQNKNQYIPQIERQGFSHKEYFSFLRVIKFKLNSVKSLRKILLEESSKYAKCTRIVFNYFMRKKSSHYLVNSKIKNLKVNMLYKTKLMDALSNPKKFITLYDQSIINTIQ